MDMDDQLDYNREAEDDTVYCNDLITRDKCYVILKPTDIRQRQQEDIGKVASVLSIPNDSACMLLIFYNWNVSRVFEAWVDDESKLRRRVGLLDVDVDHAVKLRQTDGHCAVCLETVEKCETATCGCGHIFCKKFLKVYIGLAIDSGRPRCLKYLRCPERECNAVVGPDMVKGLVNGEEMKRYEEFLVKSYVESSKNIKWCPGPGCGNAVQFDDDVETVNYDVCCECKHEFCWKCLRDAHRPVCCEVVAKWESKNTAEAMNTKWILEYKKQCPKCKRLTTEKNNGCMSMTCLPCGYEFCWLCLGPYKEHYGRPCNKYNIAERGLVSKTDRGEEALAKKALKRYTHYYERWDANEQSRKQALCSLDMIRNIVNLEIISSTYGQPATRFWFLKDAWLRIAECRHVLKWSYAYGYYLPETEQAKKMFFEHMQGDAEAWLERLQHCAENEVKAYIKNEEAREEEFNKLRMKLIGLTRVTRSYFENLVRALETGLSEVDYHKTCTGLNQDASVSSSKVTELKRPLHQCGESPNRESESPKRMRMMTMGNAKDEERRNVK